MHNLTNSYCHFECRFCEILPVQVVKLDTVIHQKFWCVAKSNLFYDSIATIWVLTWFLEIKNSFHVELFHLPDYVMLLN